jgi:hypothetical protein
MAGHLPVPAHQHLLMRPVQEPVSAISTGLVRRDRFAGRTRRETRTMKTFTAAIALLTVLAIPAHAQAKRPKEDGKKTEEKRPEVDEKAYKAALDRIPASKDKYDPWGVARPAEPAKKPR